MAKLTQTDLDRLTSTGILSLSRSEIESIEYCESDPAPPLVLDLSAASRDLAIGRALASMSTGGIGTTPRIVDLDERELARLRNHFDWLARVRPADEIALEVVDTWLLRSADY